MAFDHAARLYRIALELHSGSPDAARPLWKKLGDSLANAGRGPEAAQAYLKAAEGASDSETLEFKRLAASQLLISGHVDEGLALLRTLLGPLGIGMPDSPARARLSLLWHRALLKVRGLRVRLRQESQIPPLDLTRVDLCWSAVAGLSMIEPMRGADFQTRGLLLALKAGEPVRIARALAMEAIHCSTAGVSAVARVKELLDSAQEVAAQANSNYAHGMVAMARGIGALMIGHWNHAQIELETAEQIFRDRCTGVTWERDTTHNFMLWVLLQTGELAELQRRWTVFYRESQERGDVYAVSLLSDYYMTMITLARNDRLESEPELEATVDHRGGRTFNLRHSAAVESLIHLSLYRSDITKAWARITTVWPEYDRSMLLRIQMVRINMLELRARIALAFAERTRQNAVYMRQAKDDARALGAEGSGWASATRLTSVPASPAARKTQCVRSTSSSARSPPTIPPRCRYAPGFAIPARGNSKRCRNSGDPRIG